MLTSIEKLEQLDNKGINEADAPVTSSSTEPKHEQDMAHLSRRLACLRWKEPRCGKVWTEEPGRAPELHRLTERQGKHVDRIAHGKHSVPSSTKHRDRGLNDFHTSLADHVAVDLQRICWLMDPDNRCAILPETFVPLMFWLGFSRQRRAALSLLEMAFGVGCIVPMKILDLAPYVDVRISIAETFKEAARRESFDQLCEYITDQSRLRKWWSSMNPDSTGRVELSQFMKWFSRMQVPCSTKVLFRFLSYCASVHSPHEVPQTRFTFPILYFVLSRCVVSFFFVKVMDLLDPLKKPRAHGGYYSLAADGSAQHSLKPDSMQGDSSMFASWAKIHRRIVFSFLVNHRYWGREGKSVMATMAQGSSDHIAIFQDLTPENWFGLFQRVRAQGIASILPQVHESDDPEFLLRKSVSAADDNSLDYLQG
jgi:hypothetical protein